MAQDPDCGTCAVTDEACVVQDALDDANDRIAEQERELTELRDKVARYERLMGDAVDSLRDVAQRLDV